MTEAADVGRHRRGHAGRARLDERRRPDHRGRLDRPRPRRRHRRGRRHRSTARRSRCSTSSSTTEREIVTIIDGDDADAGHTDAIAGVARRAPRPTCRSRCTTAASRCTRTSSASSERRVNDRPHHAARPRRHRRRAAARASATRSGRRWPRSASTPCSTCSRPTRGAGSTARTRRASRPRAGQEALVLVTRAQRSTKRHDAQPAHDGQRRRSATAAGGMQVMFFNQPWRERQLQRGPAGRPVRQGRHVPGRAADDEPGRRPDRRPHRPHRADLPAEREGAAHHVGDRRLGRGGACARCAERGIADPVPDAGPPAARPRRSRRRRCASIHAPESIAREGAGPPAAGVRRAAAGAARARAAQARARARRPTASVTRVDGELVRRFHDALPFPLTGAQQRVDRRDRARPRRRRTRCTGCCRATSAPARRSSPSARCSPRCRAGTRAR